MSPQNSEQTHLACNWHFVSADISKNCHKKTSFLSLCN